MSPRTKDGGWILQDESVVIGENPYKNKGEVIIMPAKERNLCPFWNMKPCMGVRCKFFGETSCKWLDVISRVCRNLK